MIKGTLLALVLLTISLSVHADSAQQNYFPPAAHLQEYDFWFPKHLDKAKEPSLWKLSQAESSKEVYRVMIFPPFSWVILFRLEVQADGTGLLSFTEIAQDLEVRDGTGPVRRKGQYLLSAAGVSHFKKMLNGFDFWHQPTQIKEIRLEDATELVIEGIHGGKYHVIVREAPSKGEPLAAPVFYLLDLIHETVDDY